MTDDERPTGSPEIGWLFELARTKRGLTRTRVETDLGWPDEAVYQIERKVRSPKLDAALRYAAYLGISMDELGRAAGVEGEAERTSSALVVEHVLASANWTPAHLAGVLGVDGADIEAWRSGSERVPEETLRRLLLVLPIRPEHSALPPEEHDVPGGRREPREPRGSSGRRGERA